MHLAWTENSRLPSFGNFDLWSVSVWWVYPKPLVKSMKSSLFTGMIFITWLRDNVRCKGHQICLKVKRTSRLRLKRKLKSVWKSNAFKTQNTGCVLHFERKRKIANAKIYEEKSDLYCISFVTKSWSTS